MDQRPSNESERRTSLRTPWSASAYADIVAQRVSVRGRDLSSTGVAVQASWHAARGQQLSLELELAGHRVFAWGEVMWSCRAGNAYAWGIRFVAINARGREQIDRYLGFRQCDKQGPIRCADDNEAVLSLADGGGVLAEDIDVGMTGEVVELVTGMTLVPCEQGSPGRGPRSAGDYVEELDEFEDLEIITDAHEAAADRDDELSLSDKDRDRDEILGLAFGLMEARTERYRWIESVLATVRRRRPAGSGMGTAGQRSEAGQGSMGRRRTRTRLDPEVRSLFDAAVRDLDRPRN